jgi:arylformamidase
VTRYDISVAYGAATPPWPGDTPYSCGWAWDMRTGASVNVGRVVTSWHVGTHADAPLHVSPAGAASEHLPLAAFRGPATVIDARDVAPGASIGVEWLTEALAGRPVPERLLLRTGCSVATGVFPDAWPTLSSHAAAWLTDAGLRLFGTDAPSVDARTATELVVHHALFGGGAYVLENLALGGVPVGEYLLSAYPVLVLGADAAPVRAVLETAQP